MLASGLVTLAHRSGGPLMDIVTEAPEAARTGYLAISEDEYAEAVIEIVNMNKEAKAQLRVRAKSSVKRYIRTVLSQNIFKNNFSFFSFSDSLKPSLSLVGSAPLRSWSTAWRGTILDDDFFHLQSDSFIQCLFICTYEHFMVVF